MLSPLTPGGLTCRSENRTQTFLATFFFPAITWKHCNLWLKKTCWSCNSVSLTDPPHQAPHGDTAVGTNKARSANKLGECDFNRSNVWTRLNHGRGMRFVCFTAYLHVIISCCSHCLQHIVVFQAVFVTLTGAWLRLRLHKSGWVWYMLISIPATF